MTTNPLGPSLRILAATLRSAGDHAAAHPQEAMELIHQVPLVTSAIRNTVGLPSWVQLPKYGSLHHGGVVTLLAGPNGPTGGFSYGPGASLVFPHTHGNVTVLPGQWVLRQPDGTIEVVAQKPELPDGTNPTGEAREVHHIATVLDDLWDASQVDSYSVADLPEALHRAATGLDAASERPYPPGPYGRATIVTATRLLLIVRNISTLRHLGVHLAGHDFSNADLSHLTLVGARLEGTNLAGADLAGARLDNTNLTGANLTGANGANAHFSHSNITTAQLLTMRGINPTRPTEGLSEEQTNALLRCLEGGSAAEQELRAALATQILDDWDGTLADAFQLARELESA